jgi:hypothetical protein
MQMEMGVYQFDSGGMSEEDTRIRNRAGNDKEGKARKGG